MPRRPVPPPPPDGRSLERHPALVPLSRDHHFALVQSLGLRRAAAGAPTPPGRSGAGAVAVAEAYLAFYADELLGHIADEDEVLLPRVVQLLPDGAQRLRSEHEEIHELTALLREALSNGADPRGLMRELGELLEDHVRYEERAFFEAVQAVLPAAQIEELGTSLEGHRRERGRGPGCALRPPPMLRRSR
jgi:hemerythrin-like domain-containing protein